MRIALVIERMEKSERRKSKTSPSQSATKRGFLVARASEVGIEQLAGGSFYSKTQRCSGLQPFFEERTCAPPPHWVHF